MSFEADRLLANRKITLSGCWEWTGCRHPTGYGMVTIKRKGHRTHILSYKEFKGPVPSGLLVCHTCDNPPCFNPDHLWLGTHKDNAQDAKVKGRLVSPRGEDQGVALLTNVQAREARTLKAAGWKQRDIATLFGVGEKVISDVVRGRTYRELPQIGGEADVR